MKYFSYILLLCLLSLELFSQEYEIAWEKDIGGSYAQFSKNGEFIFVAKGNTISKYRSIDGSFVSTFDGTGFVENSIQIYGNFYLSGQGNYLTVCTDRFSIWDTRTEKGVRKIKNINCVDISSDEKYLLIADKNLIYKTLLNDTLKLKSKSIYDNVIILKVSHNGKMFATASETSSGICFLTLWDTETFTEIKRFDIEGGNTTTFGDIKFSWDDKFVGVKTVNPLKATIIEIPKLKEYYNSALVSNFGIGNFDFLSNHFIFNYNNYNTMDLNIYFVNNQSLKLDQNLKTMSTFLITNSEGLIFTEYSLLRPKTVGVTESNQNRLLISPNPASDYIEINVGAGSKPALENPGIEIYNIFGEKNPTLALPVWEGTGKVLPNGEDLGGVFKIDISNLAPGIYFIKIGDKFEKFVKW